MKKNDFIKIAVAGIVGMGAGAGGFYLKYRTELEFVSKYNVVVEAYDTIKSKYYMDDVDDARINQNLVDGLIDGLDDPFCGYSPKDEWEQSFINNAPSMLSSGFSVERDIRSKLIRVTNVVEGSQAEKMGLKKGDMISAIDGVKVEKDNFGEVGEMLLGKDGTKMKLEVLRDDEVITIDFVRVNDGIQTRSLEKRVLENNIGYIKFDEFGDFSETNKQNFPKIMDELGDVNGLILDMRENGGGSGEDAIGIFDYFADSGSELRLKGEKNGFESVTETTDGVDYHMPVVVLTSGKTASSAEIIAALFQSTGRGTVVGTQTYGKGVFQYEEPLSDASIMTLVEGYYYVNDVPNYNGVGITPDIVIKMDNELIGTDEDIQLKKAIELLS